jgi:hypothetical protein
MFTRQWYACCLVTGAFICSPVMSSHAEDDPFENSDKNPAAVEDSEKVKPAPATEVPGKPTSGSANFCRYIGESDSTAAARIEHVLGSPLTSNGMDFAETPLENVVNSLQDEYGISMQIDEAALEATGLDLSEPISFRVHNVSLRSGLRLMLNQVQLTYIIQNEVLMITTPEEAEADLITCVYDVRNLVDKRPAPKGASAWADFDPLVDAITSCIATETWKENGKGEADIRPVDPGFLVVAQTQAVHDEISDMLTAIREMRYGQPHAGNEGEAAP